MAVGFIATGSFQPQDCLGKIFFYPEAIFIAITEFPLCVSITRFCRQSIIRECSFRISGYPPAFFIAACQIVLCRSMSLFCCTAVPGFRKCKFIVFFAWSKPHCGHFHAVISVAHFTHRIAVFLLATVYISLFYNCTSMEIHNIRLQLRQKAIYAVPLRVSFYTRVFADIQEQWNCLTNQISCCKNENTTDG